MLKLPPAPSIEVVNRYYYNPRLEYKIFMVPGILFQLLILVGGMIAALNIVRQKEIGTQEQLNVTPIRKYEFIIVKLTPFVLIRLKQYTLGLCIALLVFKVPLLGSVGLLYLFALVFLDLVGRAGPVYLHHLRDAAAGCVCRLLLPYAVYPGVRPVFQYGEYARLGAVSKHAKSFAVHRICQSQHYAQGQYPERHAPLVFGSYYAGNYPTLPARLEVQKSCLIKEPYTMHNLGMMISP